MNTQEAKTNKRKLWIDTLRGAGIILVLLGHASPPFMKIIYGFHMALFFCLSGYLYKDKEETISEYLKRALKRYILPYFILCFINLLLDYLLHLLYHEPFPILRYIIGIFYSRGTSQWLPNCSPLWYLTAAFMAGFLFFVVQQIHYIYKYMIIIGLSLCSVLLAHYQVFKLPWNADTAMMATGFMALGFYGKEKRILQRFSNQVFSVRIAVFVLLISLGCFAIMMNPISAVSFDSNRYGNVVLMYIGALTLSAAFFLLFYSIPWKGVIANYLSYLGKHTIFLMGFDSFAGGIATGVLGKIGGGGVM